MSLGSNKNEMLGAALHYRRLGFSVIPLKPRSKEPMILWKKYQEERASEEKIQQWFTQYPEANIGIVTGKISNLVVLDVEEGGKSNNLPPTVTAWTGGNGCHYYYRYPKDKTISNATRVRDLIDVRGEGGYAVAPPSVHSSGRKYKWAISPRNEDDFGSLPEWVLQLGSRKSQPKFLETVGGVPEGQRNVSETVLVGKLLSLLPKKDWGSIGWPLVRAWNAQNKPPLSEEELCGVFESIAKREIAKRGGGDRKKFKLWSAGDLLAEKFDEREWLVEHLIPMQSITVLSGNEGTFKTWISLELARCLAVGEPLFGKFSTVRISTLFVDEENRARDIQKRLRQLGIKSDMPIFHFIQNGFRLERDTAKILRTVEEKDIGLVVFDSLLRMHSGDENDASNMARVLRQFQEIANTGANVLFIHHHRKEVGYTRNISHSMRGSSDIAAFVDCHLAVQKLDDDKIRITQGKLRQSGDGAEPFIVNVIDDHSSDSVSFEYGGKDTSIKKRLKRAQKDILDILRQSGEQSRKNIIEYIGEEYSKSMIDVVLQSLVESGKINRRTAAHNRKLYSLAEDSDQPIF